MAHDINKHYTHFYETRNPLRVYPTELVVRMFLARYPKLNLDKSLYPGAKVLDIGFGDGRNTVFLCDQGFDVYGTEITEDIVRLTQERLQKHNLKATLSVGRNSSLPYEDGFFDYILACHACYYIDDGQTMVDNLREIQRVLKPGGTFLTSVPQNSTYLLRDGIRLEHGATKVTKDPYNNRVGYTIHGFDDQQDIEMRFSAFFENFRIGSTQSDYFGIEERCYWIVCQRPS
jgi:ubiquinone/menaquinone biosynthesis C-methylase UbiE